MFRYNREAELTTSVLEKMIHEFQLNVVPKMRNFKDYYDGKQEILNKAYTDATKPCNKVVVNICKNIADSYCGYLATPSFISYSSDNDIADVMDILRYNDYQAEDNAFLLDALVYSAASELMFNDKEGKTRFRLINPLTCFGIFDDSLTEDLIGFVRFYKENEWDDNNNTYCFDVYDDVLIKHYKAQGIEGKLEFIGEEPHYFGQCPANIFMMPEGGSIYECVLSIQDAYNKLLSAEIDDFEAFCDAYLALEGVDADTDDVVSMKENRVLLLPEGAKTYWVTKNANDTQIENILKRLQESAYRVAQCPDFSSESFVGGVSSGIAIQYRLTGMETRAGKIQAQMLKALQRRIELICGIAALKLGEEVFRDINIDFKRNIPVDESSIINLVNSLKGSVSDETLLAQIPFIDDVNAELERLNKQKQENLALYGYGTGADEEEEEEEEEVA